MTDLSTKTFAIVDHGLFIPLARRLAQSGARVLFHNPSWQRAFPTINEGIIGDGFADFKCVPDIWEVKNQVDCFVFPDIYHMGMQKELCDQGFAVWGSAGAMRLETDRHFFLAKLGELGLAVPPFETIVGVTRLRDYLSDKQDIWIKMSKWRGSFETVHFRNLEADGWRLDSWAVRFGGVKELVRFLCFPKIETQLEIGADTYCIDGQWPSLMLHGIEKKDEAYFAAVTERPRMPEQLLPIMDALSGFLAAEKYRCAWSMEVRVADDADYFIDATCRGGLPSTGSQLALWKNLPEIIWHGAQGELVEPEPAAKFSAECMVKVNGEHGSWDTIVIPEELKEHLNVAGCCMVKGQPWFPPEPGVIEQEIGWLVATGDTPTEAAQEMNRLADLLPDGADAAVESLADIIREVEAEKSEGIRFTDLPMPEPEIVLAPAGKQE